MMDILLNNHDITIASGDIQLCSDDQEAIAQAITIRLKTMAGEWFLDSTRGLPYLTDIFGHKRSERFISHLIVPEVNAISGVKNVSDFKVQVKNDRKLTVSFTAYLSNDKHVSVDETIGI
jgi:hypothetical protein